MQYSITTLTLLAFSGLAFAQTGANDPPAATDSFAPIPDTSSAVTNVVVSSPASSTGTIYITGSDYTEIIPPAATDSFAPTPGGPIVSVVTSSSTPSPASTTSSTGASSTKASSTKASSTGSATKSGGSTTSSAGTPTSSSSSSSSSASGNGAAHTAVGVGGVFAAGMALLVAI